MTHLLDTDTCIHLLRGREPTVARARRSAPVELAISAITRYELLTGVEKCPPAWQRKEGAKVRLLLDQLRVVPFTSDTAGHAARLRADLERIGRCIGPMDVLIAATAIEHDLPLVTCNISEFSRVEGLRCETWSD